MQNFEAQQAWNESVGVSENMPLAHVTMDHDSKFEAGMSLAASPRDF